MGWKSVDNYLHERSMESKNLSVYNLHYSTDIAAAWDVVEKVGLLIDYFLIQDIYKTRWLVMDVYGDGLIEAGTAPMAICLATLKLKGIEL